MKQAERGDAWAKVDAQAQEVFKDDASMKGFLGFMAQCTPQSTRNLLILYNQNKEITHPGTFDKWKEAGRSIRSGEKGYIFFADQEYTKEDGTIANGYTITKAYDISQTRGPQPLPPQKHLPEEIIAAMAEQSPVQLAISNQLPQGVQAQYVPKQHTIFVRNGMHETTTICAIAREQAHASFDTVGSGYYRQAYAAQSYCAVYVVAQRCGLDTVLPYGLRRIQAIRTLTTESTAVLIPFRAQEIMQTGGIYYGQNAVSKNMIVADRRKLLNGNSFRLGVSGSGKSFSAKEEIVSIALSTNDDILILDPESEFGFLVEALGGEIIRISAASDTHLNALDMDKAYGDERNPLIEKSEFILSLFEQLVGEGGVSAKEKSILDRCTYDVYREYMANNYEGEAPTLKDLYHSLLKQPEPEARRLALSAELFITGSLNTFAQHTNVDTKARIIAYDIRELGEQLMPIGMLVTLDAIFNRVIQNWKKGKTTWVFADEFYLLFRYQYSADFFYKLWKRIRKYNGLVTGLTQNIEELLRSDTARLMLANSEFLLLLNQSSTDRDELANLLHISDTQLGYITNVAAGCGLIRCAGNIVPFENSFPRNTRLYQLMTTKPDEALRGV